MKLADVMTTQEAGERWYVPADSIKQCCLKRYANKQFTDNEARKSGKNWLVTRQGMERLYGKEEYTIENLTNIKSCLIKMNCIIEKINSIDEWEKYQDKFNKSFEYLLSYDLPEEVYSIKLIKSLLGKKDIETIKILISICHDWIRDELAGVHRQVFSVEEE
jgi:hypothetical protein